MNSVRRTCRILWAALLAVHLILPITPCPADIYRWQGPSFFDRLILTYADDDLRTIVDLSDTYQRDDSAAVQGFSRPIR